VLPRRGEIYLVSLNPALAREARKARPALVVSNDVFNAHSELVTVLPITSKGVDRIYPSEVAVPAGGAGLTAPSKVQADQIRTLSIHRLRRRLGALPQRLMALVEQAIAVHLDLAPSP
jgi:mRNA interferase MazF